MLSEGQQLAETLRTEALTTDTARGSPLRSSDGETTRYASWCYGREVPRGRVGQRLEERNELLLLRVREPERLAESEVERLKHALFRQRVAVIAGLHGGRQGRRIVVAVRRVGVVVMIDDRLQRPVRPVMHVRRGELHVPQRLHA